MVICECGCGEPLPEKHLFRYRPPYYLRGHGPRIECACGCGEYLPYSPSRRYLKSRYMHGHWRRTGETPLLCACGCGRLTTVFHGRAKRFINHVRDDNRPENLQLVHWSEHGTKHGHPAGVPLSNEHRRKVAEAMKRVWAERKAAR